MQENIILEAGELKDLYMIFPSALNVVFAISSVLRDVYPRMKKDSSGRILITVRAVESVPMNAGRVP